MTPNPGLAWYRTGGLYRGRLYIVYTDWLTSGQTNTDICVIHSDNNGTNWSNALKINTDITTTSQFFPRIAVDQTSGKVAVSWYDCRADGANVKARFYAAVSNDGGATFSSNNLQLEPGQSDAPHINSNDCLSPGWNGQFDYYDYTGLAYYGGFFYSAWADNSNQPANNPDGTCGMDIFVVRVQY
jgi:hypothetical protein